MIPCLPPPRSSLPAGPIRPLPGRTRGSTLVVVLILGAVLLLLASGLLHTLSSTYRTSFESASWQQSLLVAEGGADLALSSIQASAPDPTLNLWTGWTNATRNPNGPWVYDNLSSDSLALTHGGEGATAATLAQLTVDVYTRESSVDVDPQGTPWYRIRSVGRVDVPGTRYAGSDGRDARLRRMRLATDAAHPDRGVIRGVEIIARPAYLYKSAIWTVGSMALGNSNNWQVDSFNSITGATNTKNGNIASNTNFVTLNGANVYGSVRTQGGDNHATYYGATNPAGGTYTTNYYENVGGASYLSGGPTAANPSGVSNVAGTISDEFSQEAIPTMMPVWAGPGSPVALSTPSGTSVNPIMVAGRSSTAPTYYVIPRSVNGFTVTAPTGLAAGQKAYVNIAVDGDVSGHNIVVPPNVVVKLYVNGNLDFGSGNAQIHSGGVAADFQVFGVKGVTLVNGVPTYTGSTASLPYFSMGGNESAIMTFYGPQYDVAFNGTVDFTGSVVGNSFSINGGGNGGFHYDDALGGRGPINRYEVASYFEDNRIQP